MASCLRRSDDAGYATPAALVLCLALAMMAGATVTRSVVLLRQSRAQFDRTQTEYALAGAQLEAVASVVRSGVPGPFRWTASTDQGAVEVLAEREADKLTLEAASQLDNTVLARFGVQNPGALRAQLTAVAAEGARVPDVGAFDGAELWRICAARLISGFGRKAAFQYVAESEPANTSKTPLWRVGEEWRIRAMSTTGWRDDRIVRFTGDERHPVATVVRRVSRGDGEGGRCVELLQAAGA